MCQCEFIINSSIHEMFYFNESMLINYDLTFMKYYEIYEISVCAVVTIIYYPMIQCELLNSSINNLFYY